MNVYRTLRQPNSGNNANLPHIVGPRCKTLVRHAYACELKPLGQKKKERKKLRVDESGWAKSLGWQLKHM